ncbi:hypothetical protein [Algihabitans albus]|uniref:hypothetical protein n=1 Tax=Algihabitans albus TaxID=2164067 RepID=UPI000E5CF24D|nr:hypothetical protein [Algihabitans albus]
MSSSEPDGFDVVLALDYFRSGAPFLCLLQALVPRYRIGLYLMPLAQQERDKAGHQQDRFVEACTAAGAELIEGTGHRCDLMIVLQRPYGDSAVEQVFAAVQPRRVVGLMPLAMAGLDRHERYLSQFGVEKLYVPCDRFRRFLLNRRNAEHWHRGLEVEQVGFPYGPTRLEPDFRADWVVATPTGFSFRHESHKHAFLHTVLNLLAQIDPDETVIYKPHNGEYRDYLAPPGYVRLAQALRLMPGASGLAQAGSRAPAALGRFAAKLYTAFLHERVLRRCTPIREVTKRDWLPFEAFLPGVRRGVIGGLSNTMWGTLYFGLPFYNCVDKALRDSVDSGAEASARYLDVNLEFFGVPFCHGRLDFAGARGKGIVHPEDREGDLIAAVEADLAAIKEQQSCTG